MTKGKAKHKREKPSWMARAVMVLMVPRRKRKKEREPGDDQS